MRSCSYYKRDVVMCIPDHLWTWFERSDFWDVFDPVHTCNWRHPLRIRSPRAHVNDRCERGPSRSIHSMASKWSKSRWSREDMLAFFFFFSLGWTRLTATDWKYNKIIIAKFKRNTRPCIRSKVATVKHIYFFPPQCEAASASKITDVYLNKTINCLLSLMKLKNSQYFGL